MCVGYIGEGMGGGGEGHVCRIHRREGMGGMGGRVMCVGCIGEGMGGRGGGSCV